MRRYDLLLADADGTLFDFDRAEDAAFASACAAMGLASGEEATAQYKRVNADCWRRFERGEITQETLRTLRFSRYLEESGLSADAIAMADAFVEALSKRADLLPGAEAFLREAASRVPVVLVTNGIAYVQRSRLACSPFLRHLRGVVISGEVGCAKPDPRIFRIALEIGGAPASRALMLGDELRSDVAGARAANVASCWFNPTGRKNDTPHRPDYEIKSLEEALQWL